MGKALPHYFFNPHLMFTENKRKEVVQMDKILRIKMGPESDPTAATESFGRLCRFRRSGTDIGYRGQGGTATLPSAGVRQ